MSAAPVETYRRAFPKFAKPMLSYGIPFAQACRKHVEEYGASKVYIIASGTLSRKTGMLRELQHALDGMVVGVRTGMTAHTLINECLEVLAEVRSLGADIIVTLGGGSLSDAAKCITFAEANGCQTKEDVVNLPHCMNSPDQPYKPTRMPYILIPTTLSGGEYSSYAGVTDKDSDIKYQLRYLAPADVIILSGELAVTTPEDVWVASGVRAIDHCVECLCTSEKKSWDVVGPACVKGLEQLVPSMLKTRANPNDAAARHYSQLGVTFSLIPLQYDVFPGCSHGIGHLMGPMGVIHGMTSAVLMPSVHKYNASVNEADQAVVRQTLWDISEARQLFDSKGLQQGTADLGDLLDAILRELKMPRSLTEVGITGEEKLQALAKNSMEDPLVHANPRKIHSSAQVLDILRMCE